MSQEKTTTEKKQWYKSPWVIGWLLLLATVLGVNIFMIIQSITKFPGLVVDDFYQRGQNYEKNIHKKLKNNEHWKTQFKYSKIYLNRPATIQFSITDQQGNKARVEHIKLYLYRPSNAKKDFSMPMSAADKDNTYQASVTFDRKGKWDILASVVIDGTEVNYGESIYVDQKSQ